jgi:hypothetical protein
VTNDGIMHVAADTTAQFDGLVNGAGDIAGGGTSVFNGGFSPGNSPGLVTIAGDAIFGNTNTLQIEIAGLAPGTGYDVVDVSDDAFLDGTLDVDFLSGFSPTAGDSFDVLFAQILHGTFASTLLPALGPGLAWDVQYLLDAGGTDTVRLSVSAVPVPAAVWMFVSGLATLGWLRRRGHSGTVD